jgi:predicted MFS family arabinose efflux permease
VRQTIRESLQALHAVFRNPNLRRLQLAFAGSITGIYAFSIAVAVYAYDHGGAAAVGVMALVRTIPCALLAPFASGAGDRFRQERVMLGADLARAAIVAAIAVVVVTGGPVALVFVLAAASPVFGTAFHPAQAALLPVVADSPEELTAANVSSATIDSIGSFVGPALAGIVLAAFGIWPALVFTIATYLWSAALIARVHPTRPVRAEAEERAGGTALQEALAGFRTVAHDRDLRVIVGLFTAQTVVAGALGVLVVVSSLRLLGLGNSGVGWLYSATGIGGLVGSAVALALVGRRKLAGDFGVGLLLWGVPFLVIAAWPNATVALLMLGVLGVGNTLVDVAGYTLMQRQAPERVRSRVFGVFESASSGAMGLGAILAPAVVALGGVRVALIATGALLPVLTGLYWRRLAALDAPPPEHLALLRAIPLFAPLPPPTLERLARALEPVDLAAGETLFAAGDAGDRFYVVESGELGVDLATGVKVEGPGRFVGEIALLHDVPRTATVRARTDARLLALPREEFVAAVTGHERAADAAQAIAAERLALSPV